MKQIQYFGHYNNTNNKAKILEACFQELIALTMATFI